MHTHSPDKDSHKMHGSTYELPLMSDGSRLALSLQTHHDKGVQLLLTVLSEDLVPKSMFVAGSKACKIQQPHLS
jgi:hypothetical protein